MNNNQVLSELVKSVKSFVKESGGKLTQEQMADKLGIGRSYLSRLVRGHETVSNQFIALFKETFKSYLPDLNSVTRDDIEILHASQEVILRTLAKLQKHLPGGTDPAKFYNSMKEEIKIASIERHDRERRQ
jgi:transcriptional regulator with XRE-family HTH domain